MLERFYHTTQTVCCIQNFTDHYCHFLRLSPVKMKIVLHQLLSLWSFLLTLPVNVWSCTKKSVSCTFGLQGECGWKSMSEKRFENKLDLGNYYMFVDMGGDAQANVTSLYGSPLICATHDTHTVTFRYSLETGRNCHMTSYVRRSDARNISLWDSSVFVESRPYSHLSESLICPQVTTFQIIIEVTKNSHGGCGEVRMDDVKYELATKVMATCRVTPATSTPTIQGKISPEVQSAETVSSSNSTLEASSPYYPEQFSTNTLLPQDTSSSSQSAMFQSSGLPRKEEQTGSAKPQDKIVSAGLGAGIGLTVFIFFIITASVTMIVVRKKWKRTSEKRTMILTTTTTSIQELGSDHILDNKKLRNAQELIAPEGDMTLYTELPVDQHTTHDDRVASFDHVITEEGSLQDSSQENYDVLFSKVSEEPATQYFELDTYSHLQEQNATGNVPHNNTVLGIVSTEVEQRNMSDDSKAGAPQDTTDDYADLRASLNTRGTASGSDVYDHLINDVYVNVTSNR